MHGDSAQIAPRIQHLVAAAFAVALLLPAAGLAQETVPEVQPTTVAVPVQVDGTACVIGDHDGVEASDAATATRLICRELRNSGVTDISDPMTGDLEADSAYVVYLGRLGTRIYVTLRYESPLGTVVAEEEMPIDSIEVLPEAAPSLVQAVLNGVPVGSSPDAQGTGTVARESEIEDSGMFLLGLGVYSIFTPGTEVTPGVAGDFRAIYGSPTFSLGAVGQFGGGPGGGDVLYYGAFALDGRYFFSPRNAAPFVGGGIGWQYIRYNDDDDGIFRDSGVGLHIAGGVELGHRRHKRFMLEARINLPFFAPLQREVDVDDPSERRYSAPFELGFTYLWSPGASRRAEAAATTEDVEE